MTTPILDFLNTYAASDTLRLHMPGHKGLPALGCEALDITEIAGADALYEAGGIIAESERSAAALFGSARTLYSTEGSSQCIRAMVFLALQNRPSGAPGRILAGRNAHKAFLYAAALCGAEVDWLWPRAGERLTGCTVTPAALESALASARYAAVYVTSPDYLGQMLDIAQLAAVCRAHRVPLLVDNAHGAYLKFLPEDEHPITLGADACCDSAHKTLPCLTGAAYLHLSAHAPAGWAERAEQAMSLFASTSPSYLILQSLDRMNGELAGEYPARLRGTVEKLSAFKKALLSEGWDLAGDEPMKLTLRAAERGYTGTELQELLRAKGIECEFSDREYLVLMPSPETSDEDFTRLLSALRKIPQREPLADQPPVLPVPEKACSIREAMFSRRETVPVDQAVGRILADACVSCPPAVPVIIAGERITPQAAECMKYYGITECECVL